MKTVLVLSIHHLYAERILSGRKKIELRRTRPRLRKGDIVLVYSPRPVMALVGGFDVKKLIEARPDKLWDLAGSISGISKTEFDEYYSGASRGFGIWIAKTWRLQKPLSLQELKRLWSNFSPPQSFRYLRADEVSIARTRPYMFPYGTF